MPRARGGTVHAPPPPRLGVGFRVGRVSRVFGRLRLCHPRAAVPGTAPSSSPGGCSLHGGARAAPPALGLPWIWAMAAAPPVPGAEPLLAPGSAAALAVSPVLGKGLGCHSVTQAALWTWAGTGGCRGR